MLVGKEYGQNADYETRVLEDSLILYAATDAFASRLVAETLLEETVRQFSTPPVTLLQPGSRVHVQSYGRVVAIGTIAFVGNFQGTGISERWGNVTVGANKALVQLDTILKQ